MDGTPATVLHLLGTMEIPQCGSLVWFLNLVPQWGSSLGFFSLVLQWGSLVGFLSLIPQWGSSVVPQSES